MFHSMLVCRYADNRLILSSQTHASNPEIKLLLSEQFYREQIQLEAVTDNSFLGFTLDHVNRRLNYIQPNQDWQFRNASSAGSQSLKLSSLTSRLHILMRGTFPSKHRYKAAQQLCQSYISRGYCSKAVMKILTELCLKFHIKTH